MEFFFFPICVTIAYFYVKLGHVGTQTDFPCLLQLILYRAPLKVHSESLSLFGNCKYFRTS